MKVGYSRISDQQQSTSDPLGTATIELEKAGAEKVLVEVGSGRDDSARPKFRKLREMILDGEVSEVICPSQDRLGRNTELVLQFIQLCRMQKVRVVDLNGRDLAVKSADGTLLTTITAALDQHRSDLYSEKVRRAMACAREQGLPARSKIPFGLRKVRNESGRFVAVEIDPHTGPLARQRVDWFLQENLTANALFRRIQEEQPDWPMSRKQIPFWLVNPMLTGRFVWNRSRRRNTTAEHCEEINYQEDHRFNPLITDEEHQRIKQRLLSASTATNSGLRNRKRRMLTGLARCSKCRNALGYKTGGTSQLYLRCQRPECEHASKAIHVDTVFGVLQFSLAMHAKAIAPLLNRPKTTPPEVMQLESEIQTLSGIAGTESVIDAKRAEIARLRSTDTDTPALLLVGMLRSPTFWLQEEEALNHQLRMILDEITVDLRKSVKTAHVTAVKCKTSPAMAALPDDQKSIRIPFIMEDVATIVLEQERIQQVMASLGGGL